MIRHAQKPLLDILLGLCCLHCFRCSSCYYCCPLNQLCNKKERKKQTQTLAQNESERIVIRFCWKRFILLSNWIVYLTSQFLSPFHFQSGKECTLCDWFCAFHAVNLSVWSVIRLKNCLVCFYLSIDEWLCHWMMEKTEFQLSANGQR